MAIMWGKIRKPNKDKLASWAKHTPSGYAAKTLKYMQGREVLRDHRKPFRSSKVSWRGSWRKNPEPSVDNNRYCLAGVFKAIFHSKMPVNPKCLL
jgi:hypothetical protein